MLHIEEDILQELKRPIPFVPRFYASDLVPASAGDSLTLGGSHKANGRVKAALSGEEFVRVKSLNLTSWKQLSMRRWSCWTIIPMISDYKQSKNAKDKCSWLPGMKQLLDKPQIETNTLVGCLVSTHPVTASHLPLTIHHTSWKTRGDALPGNIIAAVDQLNLETKTSWQGK